MASINICLMLLENNSDTHKVRLSEVLFVGCEIGAIPTGIRGANSIHSTGISHLTLNPKICPAHPKQTCAYSHTVVYIYMCLHVYACEESNLRVQVK